MSIFDEAMMKHASTFPRSHRATAILLAVLFCAFTAAGARGQSSLTTYTGLSGAEVLYAAIGPEITVYAVDAGNATLTKGPTISVPENVQYIWQHPSKKYLYV